VKIKRLFGLLLLLTLVLCGCAGYRFQKGVKPYGSGYVVSRDGLLIPEYTIGENKAAPELPLAKERFKRRRYIVERYYKQLGDVENRFKRFVWDPPKDFLKIIFGQFKLPFIAISDYKYRHNPEYKKKIDQKDKETEEKEKGKISQIKKGLSDYVKADLAKEKGQITPVVEPQAVKEVPVTAPVEPTQATKETLTAPATTPEKAPEATLQPTVSQPQEQPKPTNIEQADKTPAPEAKISETAPGLPETQVPLQEAQKEEKLPQELPPLVSSSDKISAVIIAKPGKGYSPLTVRFYGSKSRSKEGKIVSYRWDFGDGDISTKKNPINTYYSGSFIPRYFTVILSVRDEKGNIAQSSTKIEVLNK